MTIDNSGILTGCNYVNKINKLPAVTEIDIFEIFENACTDMIKALSQDNLVIIFHHHSNLHDFLTTTFLN